MKNILIIDDSPVNFKAVKKFLEGEDVELYEAKNALEGISMLLDFNIDLIFLDIEMPDIDGYHACSIIKNNNNYQNVPIIMVSSKTGVFDKQKGFSVGANDYITKPYKKEMLLEVIKRYLPNK